jgi:hypothetical protein
LKASSGTSAKVTAPPQPTVQSSDKRQLTHTSADGIALRGPSDLPDPDFNAYRKDLADVELASQLIASHYAQPVERHLSQATALCRAPADESEIIRQLDVGERFLMLEDSVGWAWGYAGDDRRVGYVRSEALAR